MLVLQYILNAVILFLMVQKYYYQVKKIRKHSNSKTVSLKYHRDSFFIYCVVLLNAASTLCWFNIMIAGIGIVGTQVTMYFIKEYR